MGDNNYLPTPEKDHALRSASPYLEVGNSGVIS